MADLIVREQIAGFVDEATSGVPQYQIVESVPAGWDDITSINNIYNYWHRCPGVDFKRARDIIKILIDDAGGFSSLDAATKTIACIFKLGTFSERVGFIGHQNNMDFMAVYALNTKICRNARLFNADLIVRNELPYNHKDILGEARTSILDYKFFGVEGTQNLDLQGILDYIWGTTGTSYAGVGLINKVWTPETMSLTDLATTMNDILSKGKYFFKMPAGSKWILI